MKGKNTWRGSRESEGSEADPQGKRMKGTTQEHLEEAGAQSEGRQEARPQLE